MNKKLLLVILLFAIYSAIVSTAVIMASDITDAKFYSTVTVSNNGTAATNVSTTISGANTTSLIAGGYLNSSANNCAVHLSGADIPFMPGYGNNPWNLFVPSISGSGNIFDILYIKDVTGGEIRYFCGTTGMAVSDHATLEFGNYGAIQLTDVFLDTSKDETVILKLQALDIITDSSGNVTAKLRGIGTLADDYPYVASNSTGAATAASFNGTLPSGVMEGDLLIMTVHTFSGGAGARTITAPSGWTTLSTSTYLANSGHWGSYWIKAPSLLSGQTWTLSASVAYCWRMLRIPRDYYSGVPVAGTAATGSSTTPNPPSVTSGFGAVKTLYMAWCAPLSTAITAYPSGYSTNLATAAPYIGYADKEVTAISADPGTFTIAGSVDWGAQTIAVKGNIYRPLSVTAAADEYDEVNFRTAPYFQTLGVSDNATLPVTANMTFNVALGQSDSSTNPFNSIDASPTSCTPTNGPVWIYGQGYDFDGSATYIDCGNGATVDQTGSQLTIAMLIKANTVADAEWQHWISKGTDEQYQMRIVAGGNTVYGEVTTTAGRVTISCFGASGVVVGEWEEWVLTFDGTHLNIYKNGAIAGTPAAQTGTIVSSGHNMKLGVRDDGYGEFDGIINSARIYSRAWTAAEVAQDWTAIKCLIDGSVNHTLLSTSWSMPDNSYDWQFGSGDGTPYLNTISVSTSGSLVDTWSWEYAETWTGSVTGNIGTPSWRTTSSDADVSASLGAIYPVSEAIAPPYSVGDSPDFVSDNITISGNFTTGNVTGPHYPGRSILEQLTNQTGVPYQIPSTFIFSGIIIILSMLTSWFMRNYAVMSFFIKSLVNGIGYGICVGLGIFDWWMIIFFMIFEISFWFAVAERRQ